MGASSPSEHSEAERQGCAIPSRANLAASITSQSSIRTGSLEERTPSAVKGWDVWARMRKNTPRPAALRREGAADIKQRHRTVIEQSVTHGTCMDDTRPAPANLSAMNISSYGLCGSDGAD
ncbi:hypothetical protein V500_00102 [Pseudogymnoascus sp. VKM F-4518 (FW-2643)]|nr:hypothetical protein V500_00102 [Pseudogymnoascus sp. VKM F-4518 (FW-2643)]